MFGKKQEKIVTPPPPLPSGVMFHVMPGKYQGARGTLVPPAPQVIATPTPSGAGASLGAPLLASPVVSGGRKKMLVIWGIIALVVFGSGGLAIFLLTPKAPPPELAPIVAVTSPVPEPEPTLPTPPTQGGAGQAEGVGAEPTPPPAGGSTPEPVLPPPPVEIISTTDTDQDGLTDAEELLYTTDPAKADMDSDGYLDGQEVVNLYNPTGTAPIRLADSKLVQKYTNPAFGYTILYPASWTMRPLESANPREVLFTAATGEFIEVIVDDNTEGLSAAQWYVGRFPDIKPESLERLFVENLEGVWTKDSMTAYITKTNALPGKRLLYAITYNSGDLTAVNFRTTLKMMVSSFRVE